MIDIKRVSPQEIRRLIEKYCNEQEFREDEKKNFYCEYKDGRITAVFNEGGECFAEDYLSFEDMALDIQLM